MLVSEFVKKLQELPQDLPVFLVSTCGHGHASFTPIKLDEKPVHTPLYKASDCCPSLECGLFWFDTEEADGADNAKKREELKKEGYTESPFVALNVVQVKNPCSDAIVNPEIEEFIKAYKKWEDENLSDD